MASSLDETELARLEELACAAGAGDYSAHDDADDSAKFAAAACNAVPALVDEVRRLRRNYECSEKSLQRHEHMVAELIEKVEAWEWWEEVRRYSLFDAHPYCEWSNSPLREKVFKCAKAEYWRIFDAAWRAVHADRE